MNTLGHKLRVTVFGQSHAPAIGCVVEGLPAGFIPDMDRLAAFLARRAPGRTAWSTPRQESDAPEILSGLVEGRTCGAPVCAVIRNGDQRSRDYEGLRRTPRPSHADYTAWVKYGEHYDIRGGGQFSGRLTAPLCFAGALALQVLEERGVTVAGHIAAIAGIEDAAPDFAGVDRASLLSLAEKPFPVFSDSAGAAMAQAIEDARENARNNGFQNVEFFVGKAEEVLPEQYETKQIHGDVIVVDPPRKGCDQACLDTIGKMRPEQVIYVSCDSATLARDVKYLGQFGYELKRVRPVDMFGWSVHCECVVRLERKYQ